MENLKKLLNDLAEDAALEKRYASEREAIFKEYELSEDAAAAMRNEDVDRVRELSGLDNAQLTNHTIKAYR